MTVSVEKVARYLNKECTPQLQASLEIGRQIMNLALNIARDRGYSTETVHQIYTSDVRDTLVLLLASHVDHVTVMHATNTSSGTILRERVGESEVTYLNYSTSGAKQNTSLDNSGFGKLIILLDPLNIIHEAAKAKTRAEIQIITGTKS